MIARTTITRTFCLAAMLAAGTLAARAEDGVGPVTRAEVTAFRTADRDRDRVLKRDEFEVFVRAMAETGQDTARLIRFFGAYGFAFSIADANDDGRVSPAELRAADDAHREGGG
ncbi:MAG: EF-hand domain-containing protein [Pseudomonadota bacterium]